MTTRVVSPSIRFLRKVIAPARRGKRFRWHHIVSALHHVAQDPSPAATLLLRTLAEFSGHLSLDPRADLPHSMPPEIMLQSLAVQSLAQRNRGKHRALIHRVVRTAHSDLLAAIAQSSLR